MTEAPIPVEMKSASPSPVVANEDLHSELAKLRERVAALEEGASKNRMALVVCSGSLDRVLAALMLATSAAASGMEVELFFTFWGLAALRDPKKRVKKGFVERMFGWMLPKGMNELPLAQLNFGGIGAAMMKSIMKNKKLATLDELLPLAAELGVVISACDTSMTALGITSEELIDYPHLQHCGAARFIERASEGRLSMFL